MHLVFHSIKVKVLGYMINFFISIVIMVKIGRSPVVIVLIVVMVKPWSLVNHGQNPVDMIMVMVKNRI